MTAHDGPSVPHGRRAAVRDREDAVVARLQQLAADLEDAPDPRFRAATRDRLVAMAAVRIPQPAPRAGLRRVLAGRGGGGPPAAWRTRATAGLAGAAMTVTALGALAALSTDAGPGDVLYGVKRGTEQTRLALAGDDRGPTLLEFAATRLDELAALTGPAAPDVVGLLDTMDAQTREAAALLATRAVDGRDAAPVAGLAGWAEQQTTGLTALQTGLPTDAAARTRGSLGLLAEVSARAAGLQAALACAGGPATAGADELGPVPAACPAGGPGTGASPDAAAPGVPGDVPPGDERAPGGADAPADTPADIPADSARPAPRPAPGPVPLPPSGGGDRGPGPAPGGDGAAPALPDAPAVDEPPRPVPAEPDVTLPDVTLPDAPRPGAPLPARPTPVCVRPLVC